MICARVPVVVLRVPDITYCCTAVAACMVLCVCRMPGKCYNAMQACEKLGLDANGLDKLWGQTKKAKKMIKFGGGFYCGEVEPGMYVFNGFFMSMRSKFVAPGTSIYYFTIEWDSKKLSWEDFRGNVLGTVARHLSPVLIPQIQRQTADACLLSCTRCVRHVGNGVVLLQSAPPPTHTPQYGDHTWQQHAVFGTTLSTPCRVCVCVCVCVYTRPHEP